MHQILNTLYINTQGTYLHIDHETLKLEKEKNLLLQVPVHHLSGVVIFGNVLVSPFVIQQCAEDGRSLVFLDHNGGFKARMVSSTIGNVLLRRSQHVALDSPEISLEVAKCLVAGKIRNSRTLTARAYRESDCEEDISALKKTVDSLGVSIHSLENTSNIDGIRGVEGLASRTYFSTFDRMIKANRDDFRFVHRSRRPPRDRINCLLSFIYTLLLNDCISALESVGLDPQMGFLHSLRPGRPALALDLMEEFRSIIADRLILALINRQQIKPQDFEERPGGAVHIKTDPRKVLLSAYQERKQEEITHPFLKQKMPLGLVPYVQARLLARRLREDTKEYIPFTPK